jgi:hypothetical protein
MFKADIKHDRFGYIKYFKNYFVLSFWLLVYGIVYLQQGFNIEITKVD